METIQVYLNNKKTRRLATVEVLQWNKKTVWVRLQNAKIINRKIKRDIPEWERKELLK